MILTVSLTVEVPDDVAAAAVGTLARKLKVEPESISPDMLARYVAEFGVARLTQLHEYKGKDKAAKAALTFGTQGPEFSARQPRRPTLTTRGKYDPTVLPACAGGARHVASAPNLDAPMDA